MVKITENLRPVIDTTMTIMNTDTYNCPKPCLRRSPKIISMEPEELSNCCGRTNGEGWASHR